MPSWRPCPERPLRMRCSAGRRPWKTRAWRRLEAETFSDCCAPCWCCSSSSSSPRDGGDEGASFLFPFFGAAVVAAAVAGEAAGETAEAASREAAAARAAAEAAATVTECSPLADGQEWDV